VHIKGCPALLDLVIVDMPEDGIAPIILARTFLRTVKDLINVHEGNMRFELLSRDLFVVHFLKKKKSKVYRNEGITSKANYYGMGLPSPKPT
jgi:hypothetical protein